MDFTDRHIYVPSSSRAADFESRQSRALRMFVGPVACTAAHRRVVTRVRYL